MKFTDTRMRRLLPSEAEELAARMRATTVQSRQPLIAKGKSGDVDLHRNPIIGDDGRVVKKD
jgi:hypothetical protein